MNDKFMTIIVATPVVEQMRALAASWSGGDGMWKTELTQDGVTPSHHISTGYISGIIASYFPYSEYVATIDEDGNEAVNAIHHNGDLDGLVDLLNTDNEDAGLTREIVDILLPYIDVSTQNPRDAMKRLGLSMLKTEELIEV